MEDCDKKTYCIVTLLTPDTSVLGVPVSVWNNALLGRFQQTMAVLQAQTEGTQAEVDLAARRRKDSC